MPKPDSAFMPGRTSLVLAIAAQSDIPPIAPLIPPSRNSLGAGAVTVSVLVLGPVLFFIAHVLR